MPLESRNQFLVVSVNVIPVFLNVSDANASAEDITTDGSRTVTVTIGYFSVGLASAVVMAVSVTVNVWSARKLSDGFIVEITTFWFERSPSFHQSSWLSVSTNSEPVACLAVTETFTPTCWFAPFVRATQRVTGSPADTVAVGLAGVTKDSTADEPVPMNRTVPGEALVTSVMVTVAELADSSGTNSSAPRSAESTVSIWNVKTLFS